MIKQSECTGLPIINFDSGDILGRVKEFLFMQNVRKIFGVLPEGSFLKSDKIILLQNIRKMSKDAVIVEGCNILKDLRSVLGEKSIYQLKDKEIYTKQGKNLGVVKDIRINEINGDIECLEISDGIISDIINGRGILPLVGKVVFSDDCILIENEAYEELQTTRENRGGVAIEEYV